MRLFVLSTQNAFDRQSVDIDQGNDRHSRPVSGNGSPECLRDEKRVISRVMGDLFRECHWLTLVGSV
jgi:hypothetical protein